MSAEAINYLISQPAPSGNLLNTPPLPKKEGSLTEDLVRELPNEAELPKGVRAVRAGPRLGNSAATGKAPPTGDNFKFILAMIKASLEAELSRATNDGKQLEIQSKMSEQLRKQTDEAAKNELDELQKAEEKVQEQKNLSFWAKIVGAIVAVIMVVVTFGIAGPIAAGIIAAMIVLDQTGVLNKMFQGIDNPTLRAIAKVAFIATVAVLSGGLAVAGESALSSGVDAVAKVGTDEALTAIEQQIESAVADEVETSVANVAEEETTATSQSSFKLVATQVGIQEGVGLNPIQDILTAIVQPGEKDEKKKMAIAIASGILNLILALVSVKFCSISTTAGQELSAGLKTVSQNAEKISSNFVNSMILQMIKVLKNSPQAVEAIANSAKSISTSAKSTVQAALEMVSESLIALMKGAGNNPQAIRYLMWASSLVQGAFEGGNATIAFQRANIVHDLAISQSDMDLLSFISQSVQRLMQQASSDMQMRSEANRSIHDSWKNLTKPTAAAAAVLAV